MCVGRLFAKELEAGKRREEEESVPASRPPYTETEFTDRKV